MVLSQFLDLKYKVVLSKVNFIRHDEVVFPRFGQFATQEISSLDPLLQLLGTVSKFTTGTIGAVRFGPNTQWKHTT